MSGRDPQELVEGQRLLDRYTVMDRVAGGGMATIYRAMDDRLERVVCVKVLRTVLKGAGTAGGAGGAVYKATYAHFLQEALALSKLQHPNTLKIFDFGFLDDVRPFQISEYLDGGNLERRVRHRGALAPNEVLPILERMAGAIAEAHGRGIIHRDIKPSNILFARIGQSLLPKLADFGIATTGLTREGTEGQGESETVSTVTLFSPRWAAPEQLTGSEEGPSTDTYALALVTAFMLTGRTPVSEKDARSTFTDRVAGDRFMSERISELGLGGEVRDVLLQALRVDPRERTAEPQRFSNDVRAVFRASRIHEITEAADPVLPTPSPGQPESLTMEIDAKPVGPAVPFAGRSVRYVTVDERLDLSFVDASGGEVRFRITFLPGGTSFNLKGLSCFVARSSTDPSSGSSGSPTGRPTPALTMTGDGAADFVSTQNRDTLGQLFWSFGTRAADGHVFVVDGAQLLVPYTEATEAVALFISRGTDLVVVCRRGGGAVA